MLDTDSVHRAQVSVPEERHNTDEEESEMRRDIGEVDGLGRDEHPPVAYQCWDVVVAYTLCRLSDTLSFQYRHGTEEEGDDGWSKDTLVEVCFV